MEVRVSLPPGTKAKSVQLSVTKTALTLGLKGREGPVLKVGSGFDAWFEIMVISCTQEGSFWYITCVRVSVRRRKWRSFLSKRVNNLKGILSETHEIRAISEYFSSVVDAAYVAVDVVALLSSDTCILP